MKKEELKKQIEKEFLKIRGWKNWEEYDEIGGSLETEINARKELIEITIKITKKEVLDIINEVYHCGIPKKEYLKDKIEELR